ncbi:MAG: T9SS type A sorting domain-containing protein [Bacteroidia bacterium]|nr:T9SS type A sorting domain-containing protein [Bacteroidia bacterium]
MKRSLILPLLLLLTFFGAKAQVPSDCTVPPVLRQEYARDVINLAMTDMYGASSPDTAFVHVPATWTEPIWAGLAAIYNATPLAERDSVFNLYCVHDQTSMIQTYQGYLIQIDTNFSWTQAWQNLTTLTGNAPLDAMLTRYDLELSQYFNWSFGQYALLQSDSLWNNRALIDSLETIQGIVYGEPDQIIGSAGKIQYSTIGNDRYYDFFFEWSDCFDGCDNYHVWHFKVLADCSVEYLGFDEWGIFGVLPLPAPLNCNISTGQLAANPTREFEVFPNPTSGKIRVEFADFHDERSVLILQDVNGRNLATFDGSNHAVEIDLSIYAAGIYNLVLTTDQKILGSCRVVKR